MSQTQTATIQNPSGAGQYIIQDIPADYTGIYAFCGTIIFLGILFYCVIYKISEKWRIDKHKIEQLKVIKSCESNIVLLRKLDKVLDVLNKEVQNDG